MTLTDFMVIGVFILSLATFVMQFQQSQKPNHENEWRGLYYRELGQREVLERWNTWLKVRLDLAAGLNEDVSDILKDEEDEDV